MLFYCAFTWQQGTSRAEVAKRFTERFEAGEVDRDRIKGWYNLAGGGAGFLIVEYDDLSALSDFLEPFMDLTSFDVRAIEPLQFDEQVKELGSEAG